MTLWLIVRGVGMGMGDGVVDPVATGSLWPEGWFSGDTGVV
jgi:hypothetical protein